MDLFISLKNMKENILFNRTPMQQEVVFGSTSRLKFATNDVTLISLKFNALYFVDQGDFIYF